MAGKKHPIKAAAVLTIRDAPNMTLKGRRDICRWLDRQKELLMQDHKALADTYRARYLYQPVYERKGGK